MKISYNAAAMRASNALNASDKKVSKSLERLSSGLKVTTSKDNPSGYAIGKKMNTQITGISVATQCSNNGISIIETADGALTEVHEMLQRMNELAVKGATGTLTTSDRMTLDEEIKQLKAEVTRIATDTEFNGQPLLDGTFDLRGYTNNHKAKVDYYSDEVIAKKYTIDELRVVYNNDGTIDMDATAATLKLKADGDDAFPAGVKLTSVGQDKITLTGHQDFEMTLAVQPDPVKDADGNITGYNSINLIEQSAVTVPAFNASYDYVLNGDGSAYVPVLNQGLLTQSFDAALQGAAGGDIPEGAKITSITGDDAAGTDTIVITDENGFRLEIESTRPAAVPTPATQPATQTVALGGGQETASQGLVLDITGIGSMDTQTGANEGQQLAIRIPTISLSRLGIEKTELKTQDSCSDAINEIREGILYVSSARSRLGAYQNRLEHTVNNLDVTGENMTASYSRIMDVDMAEEMTDYTTEQVISQAAVSMLAQANERPSQVLQLLQ